MKNVLITQSNYIPWKGYFDAINLADVMVLYDEMQYTKRDWRNRNKIKTAAGLKWLSIPVQVKGKYHQKINETKISDPAWHTKHWNVIQDAYRSAPFWQELAPMLNELYTASSTYEYLSDINYHFITGICEWLGIKTTFLRSRDLELRGDRTEKLFHLCKDLDATHYISGPAAQNYMDTDMFDQAGISIHWMDYSRYPEYPQLHGDFEHGVSIIDLLAHTGPQASEHLFTNHLHEPHTYQN